MCLNRKLVFVTSLLLLTFPLPFVRFNSIEVKASNGYQVRNLDTRLNYATIQEAIDAPETLDGHTMRAQKLLPQVIKPRQKT